MTGFTPLRVRSHGSLLLGTATPEALVARAFETGCRSLALTDRDNLYLAIRFVQAARAEGLVPLTGAELTHEGRSVLLLALDRRGYAHLCELVTARHLDPDFDLVPALAARAAGLHAIVESPALAAALVAAGVPPAAGETGPAARPVRALGGLWMGVRGLAAERPRLGERVAIARRLGVPLVATGDCALLRAGDHDAHRVAVTAAAGELLERMPPSAFCAREAWFAPPAEWERRVRAACAGAGLPEAAEEALAHNRALAARCRLALDLGTPIFPRAPLPAGVTGSEHLMALGRAGVRRRYGGDDRRALVRLGDELEMIGRMGFTDYFLLVAEIVEFARARGIPTVGRGSGAASLVAYALGITNVDPLRYGLAFERFLNPSRRDCPDLDIDLCWWRRDEVIAHVYRTYGADRVAMIATHSTLGARSAFRETAKALGVPNARVNALARRIPRHLEPPYRERLEALPESRGGPWEEPVLAEALRLAERLDGAPRHLSVHSGGVVIGDRALTHYLPLQRAAKDVVITQFEMRAVEALGLVKMDLLGNRALSTIGECVDLARERRGVVLDTARIPEDDPATAAIVAAGDTLNNFQLESPAMRHLLRMIDARTLDRTIAAVALVRPGPAESGMKEAFCRRARGLEPAVYAHPRLEPVLRDTHGVMLYEEDVMRVAAALTGLTPAEGDDLRRAIGGARTDAEFRALEGGFVGHAVRAGVDADAARAVWRDLTRFAAYAFCKAHAAGYGVLGWHSAWLKARYPEEWAVGVLNHHAGMYPTWVHVEDLRRRGVTFVAPCAQRSAWNATLEPRDGAGGGPDTGGGVEPGRAPHGGGHEIAPRGLGGARRQEPERAGQGGRSQDGGARRSSWSDLVPSPAAPGSTPAAVRIGLSRVFGLHRGTADRIVAARARRPFRSLADLAERARPSLPEIEALALAGALDWTGRTRASLLLEARAGARAWARAREPLPSLAGGDGAELVPEPVPPLAVPELAELDLAARVRGESRTTGLWFSAHPLEALVAPEAVRGATPAAALPAHAGRGVRIVGLPCACRRVETRSGGHMLFTTLADRTGLAECVLFPDAYRALAAAVRGEVVEIAGRVDDTLGAVSVVVERARRLA